jgi:hypothetical protein
MFSVVKEIRSRSAVEIADLLTSRLARRARSVCEEPACYSRLKEQYLAKRQVKKLLGCFVTAGNSIKYIQPVLWHFGGCYKVINIFSY